MYAPLTPAWWKNAGERALSQAAEAIIPLIAAGALLNTNWQAALGVGLGGALASLLFSLTHLPDQASLSKLAGYTLRMVRTVAAAAVGVIGTAAFDVFAFDWATAANAIGAVAVTAALKMFVLPTPVESATPVK